MTDTRSLAPLTDRIETIIGKLEQAHPNATYGLDWDTPPSSSTGGIPVLPAVLNAASVF